MLAPSILSADFTNIREDFKIMNEEKCDFIHVDIMDGNYVSNFISVSALNCLTIPGPKDIFGT